jgi:hypothetical protein
MLTSDCPGSPEIKETLQVIADRTGAKFAMLVGSDGFLHACSGHHDRFTVECLASAIRDGEVWQHETGSTSDQPRVFVDVFTFEDVARLYIRRIAGDRLIVTAFDMYDGQTGIVHMGVEPERPHLCASADEKDST